MVKTDKAAKYATARTKMSVKFYDPALEEKFRAYVAENDSNNIRVVNSIVGTVFSMQTALHPDILTNLLEISTLIGSIDWDEIRRIHLHLQANALTRNATVADVVTAMIQNGITGYRSDTTDLAAPE